MSVDEIEPDRKIPVENFNNAEIIATNETTRTQAAKTQPSPVARTAINSTSEFAAHGKSSVSEISTNMKSPAIGLVPPLPIRSLDSREAELAYAKPIRKNKQQVAKEWWCHARFVNANPSTHPDSAIKPKLMWIMEK